MKLGELKAGEKCKVISVGGAGELRIRLLDMGIIPGTTVQIMKYAPMGDPVEIRLRGYELTLRIADASIVEVEKITEESA